MIKKPILTLFYPQTWEQLNILMQSYAIHKVIFNTYRVRVGFQWRHSNSTTSITGHKKASVHILIGFENIYVLALVLTVCTRLHCKGYYLQRLFLEYGSNGTLTYEGLQNLLGSLGLGEVSVLEIRHEGVKHSSPSPSHSHPHSYTDHHHPHQASSTASLNK